MLVVVVVEIDSAFVDIQCIGAFSAA